MAKGFFARLFSGFSEIDDDFYDELEEQLILGDMGVNTTWIISRTRSNTADSRRLRMPEDLSLIMSKAL